MSFGSLVANDRINARKKREDSKKTYFKGTVTSGLAQSGNKEEVGAMQ